MSNNALSSQVIEDSIDSSSSLSLGGNNNNNITSNSNITNNNVLKGVGVSPLLLSQSAELYYKQLLAANVAALTKPCHLTEDRRTTSPHNVIYAKNGCDEKAAFVWEGGQHGGGGGPGGSGVHSKCGGPASGQSQGGLVHWMSVMAEHMNNVTGSNHHDAVHYMWNGGVEQCGPHSKDVEYSWQRQSMVKQGYEAKMNSDQQNSHGMHKGGVEDGRMEPPGGLGGLYGGSARSHSSSSSSASPPHGAAALIVPHPLAASKAPVTDQHHVVTHNGSGRKYQCKMCPSVYYKPSKLEGRPAEYQARSGLEYHNSPIGGTTMAECNDYNHHSRHEEIKSCYSNPNTPPIGGIVSPQPVKARGRKRGFSKSRDGLGWTGVDHGNPEIFSSKSELQLHSQLHMREVKPYKCSQCNKTFANSSYLSQHTRIHLGIKPYRCEICQRKFTQLSHLQQHIRTHTGDKPYKCRHPGCNKAFSQLSNLQSHSRCHQTDKPYKCNSCYKCFSDEPSLLEHIPKHKESKHLKTHICQYCGKSYTQETYLTKHMQKHAERTDKRPPIIGIPRVTLDNSHYWPKVSPDTANNLVDAISQHEACLQQQGNGVLSDHLHRDMNGDEHTGRPPAPPPTPTAPSPANYHESVINSSKTNTSSASAFTPIQSMGIPPHHHNHHLNHHQISDPRPAYLSYNALAFPGTKVVTSGGQLQSLAGGVQTSVGMEMPKSVSANSFPNQLISLHQIRNYAHQPAPTLMSTEHLIQGLKEKGQ